MGTAVVLSLTYCGSTDTSLSPSMWVPPTKVGDHYQAYVETAMGSYDRLRYNLSTGKLDSTSTELAPILPLPVNAGFIPLGGKDPTDKIDVWILSRNLNSGDTLSIVPIGMIQYEIDTKEHIDLFVVPVNEKLTSVPIKRFRDLIIGYDPVKFNFEYWLRNQAGGKLNQFSWEDEEKAMQYLEAKTQ